MLIAARWLLTVAQKVSFGSSAVEAFSRIWPEYCAHFWVHPWLRKSCVYVVSLWARCHLKWVRACSHSPYREPQQYLICRIGAPKIPINEQLHNCITSAYATWHVILAWNTSIDVTWRSGKDLVRLIQPKYPYSLVKWKLVPCPY